MVDRDVFDLRLGRLEELLRHLEVDHGKLYSILTEDLGELEAYAAALTSRLRQEDGGAS